MTVRTTSPVTVLGKGNSDPFAVYTVTIGPEENDLITLYRDYMIPSAYSAELGQKHMNFLASQDWRDSLAALEDEGAALGTLARYGSIASKYNPRMQRLTYKYLVQSINVLRTKLSRGHDLQSGADCMHVNMLFAAEAISGNLLGAITHGRILLQILQKQWRERKFDYKLLIYQLFIDYQLSSMFVKRMIFDEEEWLERVLQPVWDAATPHIPIYPRKQLDPCISDEWLRSSFEVKRQQFYFMASRAETLDATSHLQLVWMSQMTRGMLFHSRMIDHYLKIGEQLRKPRLSSVEVDELKSQQYLALAAAQLDRHVGGHPKILGVHIYDTSRMTMALKHALEANDLSSRRAASRKYRNAKLWALYVGAVAETAARSTNTNPSGNWFNETLACMATAMKIYSWGDLQPILEGFLYYDGPFYIKRPACFEEGHVDS
ncbi:hypothetical protein H2200_009011 [Cladophialophora chaetospira]|uniref:Uncharacterized protein n=1 Tax=Cladophialophora chaetospira TaxID=386627 RepID=A0AA39CG83_9EURO|nr:hypothetical protein H2200_009011 [Cladophialophora chaetospira]